MKYKFLYQNNVGQRNKWKTLCVMCFALILAIYISDLCIVYSVHVFYLLFQFFFITVKLITTGLDWEVLLKENNTSNSYVPFSFASHFLFYYLSIYIISYRYLSFNFEHFLSSLLPSFFSKLLCISLLLSK